MEYVINPMWFYWLQICDELIKFIRGCGVVAIAGGIVVGIVLILALCDGCYDDETIDETIAKTKRHAIRAIICGIICVIVSMAIPSSETLIKMQIAKFGTKDNVEVVLQTINDKTDKLIEAIGKEE